MLPGGHVPLFAQLHVCMIVAVPCLWPSCMAVHGRRACGRGVVAVITAALGVRRACGRGAVVFVSPSCGCNTPMDASVCNGLCGVCVVSICYLPG